jgi:GNAT superfamily N-acetyltransferase
MDLVELTPRLAPELAAEWVAHHALLRQRDPRLTDAPRLDRFFEAEILRAVDAKAALALGDQKGWRALATGIHLTLRDDDPAQEIIVRQSVSWSVLLLRPWESLDAPELFAAMDRFACEARAEMSYATVPSCDAESNAFVSRHRFEPSFVHCARIEPVSEVPPPDGVAIHRALPGDGPKVLDVHLEEIDYHALCAPSQSTRYPGRRDRQLAGCEDVIRDRNGASLYAEWEGEVIAVADGRVTDAHLRPTVMLPAGRMGFIRSVGTRADWRGRGVGTALSLALAHRMGQQGARRWELVYCPWNPLSSRFWRGLLFVPVAQGYCARPSGH